MALSRKHFTMLAEMVGMVEAGSLTSETIRPYVIEQLRTEPQFSREKFDRHADVQRDEHERRPVSKLVRGESFAFKGVTMRADEIVVLPGGRRLVSQTMVENMLPVSIILNDDDMV